MVRQNRKHLKLFQDAIVVNIPMEGLTADLGIAVRRTREKRIKLLYEEFPSLKEDPEEEKDELDSEDDEENKGKKKDTEDTKKANNPLVPQRKQYGNVLDYLEAKYVRGVMLEDEGELEEDENEHEKGSVYDSESSFLDDSLLKRDVAEQVLSQATQTKLGLEQVDDEFFVNVGVLEVEDHELMDYDPLDEEKIKKSAKRKRNSSVDTKASSGKENKSKKKASSTSDKSKAKSESQKKSGEKKASKASSKAEQKTSKAKLTPELKEQIAVLKKKADNLKKASDKMFNKTRCAIENMTDKELPRKKKNEKVSIVVPEGKSPGDDITFSNPHVKGQKLRVKVPKNAKPGGKFVVSVPVPVKANPDVDNNKWPREAQDLLDEFSRAYDDWCHAEAAWREIDPSIKEKFPIHKKRMNKFDELLPVFPKDLITPIDGTYLRKVVRRARQNKHKRIKTAQKLSDEASVPETVASQPSADKEEKEEDVKTTIEIMIPGKGISFANVTADSL
mmetsp:Transcript_20513/g.30831  ORF Transcript_20513/g.30831 Transcript_20513/m.30831 type:complete len:504 (+) Transcript_20513:113-1624(+)